MIPPATVLVVAGSQTAAVRLRLMIEAEGAQARMASDWQDGERQARADPPGLVVVEGSDRHGEIARRVRAWAGAVPVLVVDPAAADWDSMRRQLGRWLATGGEGEAEARALAGALDQARLLVIDDSVTYREFLRHELEAAGARVQVCGDADDALRHLKGADFDGVLLDLVMPGVQGMDLCRRLDRLRRALRRRFILAVLSSRESPDDLLRSLRAGADIFLAKSQDMALLTARLGAMLRRKFTVEDHADS